MREILFRGRGNTKYNDGEWYYGVPVRDFEGDWRICTDNSKRTVIPETIGQYTGLKDKNGTKIFEGDIVQYLTYDDFDCQSVVKFGEYKQDGSCGEYGARICLGFYVEVDIFTCPDWCENEPECFSDYQKQQNVLEIANECEVIGNIHDNPELLGGNNNDRQRTTD